MRVAWAVVVVSGLLACAPPRLALPAGAACAKVVGADAASLANALAAATPGTCVVAAAGTYAGAFSVPGGVVLGAEPGVVADFTGGAAALPSVTLAPGATLTGLRVTGAPGVGVWAGPGAQVLKTQVQGATGVGLVFWCEEDCRVAEPAGLRDVELSGNAVGLLVHGARVTAVGGSVTSSRGGALASGYGVVASHGAELQATGLRVADNEELGVLVDGAQDTSVALTEVAVQNNRGRGIWAQGLTGSATAPRLSLSSCTVEGNRLVGLGARGSRGIRVQDGRIGSTALGSALAGPGQFVTVGDGVGLFEGTGDVALDAVTLSESGRSQLLVDTGAAGVVVRASTVTQGQGQYGVVVQRTSATVQAPAITTPGAGQELPISAPTLGLPTP